MSGQGANQKNIIGLYGLLVAGAILMMVPYGVVPFAGLACAIVVLFAAYFYRWRKRDDDQFKFHMTHIIRTSWLSQLILFIGILIFGMIIFNNGDMTSMNNLMNMAQNGVVPNESDIAMMQFNFVEANKSLILISGGVCLLPYPIYLIYRVIKGMKILLKKEG